MSRKNRRKKNNAQPESPDAAQEKKTAPENENIGPMSKWKEKYFTFHGRMSRREYIQDTVLAIIYCLFIAMLFFLSGRDPSGPNSFNYLSLGILLVIPTVWLLLSINIRRWHDLGRRGYFLWINLFCLCIPVLYIFLLAYLCYKKGTPGANQFGSDRLHP
ncbi:MAG: DUF805 domain-containing protein [Megasphaera sp.]|jgi:uncharacterized membrane protein YhaH (DUF805 family)|nr:DUF805 domain-containing protein [Megasphaera sp.]MCI1247910.1 DUF805 domain-containing protein [Megasphaera sp.]